MRSITVLLTALLILIVAISGQRYEQEYEDYAQDNLYHDYAMKQQNKEAAKGGGLGSMFVAGTVGWFIGAKLHCRRLAKKLNSKHKNEQKELYTQYYNDVYTLQTQNAELIMALEQMGVKTR